MYSAFVTLPNSLSEACAFFADPENAVKFVAALRWPNGACCPDCGTADPYYLKTRRLWKCKGCSRQFSVKVGTIFEDSALPLGKWLIALWLVANSKNGISSCEIARAIGVSRKTAWHMGHRIRRAMESGSFQKMRGTVEADETFVGGRRRASAESPGRGPIGKTPVFGVIERGGEVRAYRVPDVKSRTLQENVVRNVELYANLYTDNNQGYVRLKHVYRHESVSHSTGEYVVGDVHTNSIENFWCLFKRSVKGTWVRPTAKHMDRYVTDQVFRYNKRKDDDLGRFVGISSQVFGRRLTWKELVG